MSGKTQKSSTKFVSIPNENTFSGWKELLEKWSQLMDRYIHLNPPGELDVPYWYGERALTGILAASAWFLQKGWSLEEFTGKRVLETEAKTGKCDLCLGMREATYTIEAKIAEPCRTAEEAVGTVLNKLEEAKTQVETVSKGYRCGNGIALCFVVPQFLSGSKLDNKEYITSFFTDVSKVFIEKNALLASYQCTENPPKEGERVYPGVLIVAKFVPWKD